MELIKLEDVKQFVGIPVVISIHDDEGGDQPPAVKKSIKKIQYCPDGTHIRFYFDDIYFLAVPLTSSVNRNDEQWSAFDQESGLVYTVKKVQDI
ncbi:hypothetical protein [Neobacillus jeddahensis]|uniref:hypothetical protein n=1 Tax=Neobacillus jeddahensis TaxID=1461580 RepID=UPI00058BA84F|nr:hypothetical protein [Neobacillus jeddahensis]